MKSEIAALQPEAVWRHFNAICKIPRPSGHLEKITQYILDFGKNLGLETVLDEAGNVLIRKPATPGMENRKPVVLQGHMDMVPQKNADKVHNFETDPINSYIDGEWVTANGTTLGADNGIGISSILAILESETLKHGPLEALFTYDEETGMYGALGLQPDLLQAEILLNTDSEQEGELYMSCAGGIDLAASFKYKDEPYIPENEIALKIIISGLKGGHSGVDIHLGRANANKLLFRFLKHAVQEYDARLAWVSGGNLRNAIPREAEAIITIPAEYKSDFLDEVTDFEALYIHEYGLIEDDLALTAEETGLPDFLIPEPIQDDLINAVVGCRNGVARMIPGVPEVVETSSNLAIVRSSEGSIEVLILIRSSSESMKQALVSSLESVFLLAGAKVETSGDYPGWEPNLNSPVLKVAKDVHKKVLGFDPEVKIMHAGLECGIIGAAYPNLDMISFGPTIKYPHSPDERVNIASVEHFWNFLTNLVENIPAR
ncbi:aminoacyl-histidine dipeptidase [uncultured Coprobacter sp.]|uniref:aminoacyl-histidine dipeptidase n=1 Tax=uncultured Coprobacter sp. TaxID=1720550 RepID=UPI002610ACE9|nr:aminoacyl-histidine dipeptidase [uncultured Coprobacter sp.]